MRLIDADKVVSEIQKMKFAAPIRQTGHIYNEGLYDAINAIDNAEDVDAVPVVRCKDCLYESPWDDAFRCGLTNYVCEEDDFCSYAVKKEEAENDNSSDC